MYFKNKKVLITGGTGSLGQSLVSKLRKLGSNIIIYSRDEGKQSLTYGQDKDISCSIGDVRDLERLNQTFSFFKPDYVIHAAALKRIDDMEYHPDECIKTNVYGSKNVAQASQNHGVKKCILISTDKACQPVNVYGSSKFIAERLFSNFDYNSDSTIFSSIRYGNVIASRGSFIPLFMEWINSGSTINVTSESMTRFLFTLKNACHSVLDALEKSIGGEVYVPRINSYTLPLCIKALELITQKKAVKKVYGLRPGEKLHEDMLAKTEIGFAHEDPSGGLLQIRPQYTKKIHQDWAKYDGPEYNSSLFLREDVNELADLIREGLKC